MKKLVMLLIMVGMLISAGGCKQKEKEKEKLLYERIAELVEEDKTRTNGIMYNFSIEDLGMTKGQAIKTFGFPDYVNCTYGKGRKFFFWGIYKSTKWEYRRGFYLRFKDGLLIEYLSRDTL